MKNLLLLILCFISINSNAQDTFDELNDTVGYVKKKNGRDIHIFLDSSGIINLKNYRKLNSTVFFTYSGKHDTTINGIKYVLITIPGDNPYYSKNTTKEVLDSNNRSYIDKKEYELDFWINEDEILRNSSIRFTKVRGDFLSGVLTAPFKLRLNAGSAKEAYVDGSFNVGGFFGYKISFGTQTPSYLGLIGFSEFTTINYNASNNTAITDDENLSVSGFSYGFGIVFRVHDVSPGIIFGWDHGLGSKNNTFLYQDKPWISFSVNYDFIRPKKKNASLEKN